MLIGYNEFIRSSHASFVQLVDIKGKRINKAHGSTELKKRFHGRIRVRNEMANKLGALGGNNRHN